jgi:hypothetical protein
MTFCAISLAAFFIAFFFLRNKFINLMIDEKNNEGCFQGSQ